MIEIIIYISISFIIGSTLIWYILKNKYEIQINALENEANIKITSLQNLNENIKKTYEDKIIEKDKSFESLMEQNRFNQDEILNTYKNQILNLQNSLDEKNNDLKNIQENINEDKSLISKLKTQLEEQNISMNDKIDLLKNQEEKLKQDFENLANKIFDDNNKKFTQQNKQNMDLILTPMKQQISEFKKKVEDVYNSDVKDRSELKNELKTLKELNVQISTDAINLTNALKGQSKQQGIWGEMVLEKVLESSGLRLGIEYEREKFLSNDDGKSYRPDVIVNLPENRNIIIDAKTSLVAYEQYSSLTNEDEKKQAINNHLISINKHISDLSSKKYEELNGVNTLDFIFMFVPIESALMLAMQNDTQLFDKAFKQKIVLVSPTTLLVALKAIESSWRYEKQAKNINDVYDRALKLYEKLEVFVSTLQSVGKAIKTADKSYEKAFAQLSTGNGNVLRQVEMLKDVSAIKPKKLINSDLLES